MPMLLPCCRCCRRPVSRGGAASAHPRPLRVPVRPLLIALVLLGTLFLLSPAGPCSPKRHLPCVCVCAAPRASVIRPRARRLERAFSRRLARATRSPAPLAPPLAHSVGGTPKPVAPEPEPAGERGVGRALLVHAREPAAAPAPCAVPATPRHALSCVLTRAASDRAPVLRCSLAYPPRRPLCAVDSTDDEEAYDEEEEDDEDVGES